MEFFNQLSWPGAFAIAAIALAAGWALVTLFKQL